MIANSKRIDVGMGQRSVLVNRPMCQALACLDINDREVAFAMQQLLLPDDNTNQLPMVVRQADLGFL